MVLCDAMNPDNAVSKVLQITQNTHKQIKRPDKITAGFHSPVFNSCLQNCYFNS